MTDDELGLIRDIAATLERATKERDVRLAWDTYAAATLAAMIQRGGEYEHRVAAKLADVMLDERRKRFPVDAK